MRWPDPRELRGRRGDRVLQAGQIALDGVARASLLDRDAAPREGFVEGNEHRFELLLVDGLRDVPAPAATGEYEDEERGCDGAHRGSI
jgi:GrpB-like predicted nucleotidyltransferase (UPF0157 family)